MVLIIHAEARGTFEDGLVPGLHYAHSERLIIHLVSWSTILRMSVMIAIHMDCSSCIMECRGFERVV